MQRIHYIDTLKGVAIVLVVIGHLLSFSFGSNALYTMIYTFHMPLFMLLSGCVVKRGVEPKKLGKSVLGLMVPCVSIGLLFTYCHGDDIGYYVRDEFKSGYWYFLCLTIYYLAFFLSDKLSGLFRSARSYCFVALLIACQVCFVLIDRVLAELGGNLFWSYISFVDIFHSWSFLEV